MTRKEIKEMLEGCEVSSLMNEGTVYVKGGVPYRDRQVISLTDGWHGLWNEYVESELGPKISRYEDFSDEFVRPY